MTDNLKFKPQRVLHIANDYLGTSLYEALINALDKAGVSNLVFVPVKNGSDYNDVPNPQVVISSCFTEMDRLLFFSKQKKMYAAICETIDLNNVCCVHAHMLFSAGYTAMKLKETKGIPYIVAVRNTDVNMVFKNMIHLRRLGVKIMQEAERIIFLSPAYRDTVLAKYVPSDVRAGIESKSLVIPNGISAYFHGNRYEHKPINRTRIRLIYVGTANKNKNLGETIEACNILKKRGINCIYTVVGDLAGKKYVDMLHKENIKHYPKCGHDELINYYRENDIFVMPSHTETFGLVYPEAMSQGLPVIYTRGQGFDGQFSDGEVGYSVSDSDPEELADRILKVIDDYDRLSKNATKMSAKFDWDDIAREYVDIYSDLCSS